MSPGTKSTGPLATSSRARAIAPAGPRPHRSGRSRRKCTVGGSRPASSVRRASEEVETVTVEASGRTRATTRASAGCSSTNAVSLSPLNRRERPPANTMTGSRPGRGSDARAVMKAFRTGALDDFSPCRSRRRVASDPEQSPLQRSSADSGEKPARELPVPSGFRSRSRSVGFRGPRFEPVLSCRRTTNQ